MSANIIDARKDNSILYGELKAGEYFIFELDGEMKLYVKTNIPVKQDEIKSMMYAMDLSSGIACQFSYHVKVMPINVEIEYF